MSRIERCALAYTIYQEFVSRCLLDDRSLLWPELHPWTAETVSEVKRRMVDNPEWGDNIGFNAKLQRQMAGAPADAWLVLADVTYVYYLGSASMTLQTKRREIGWLAEQAGRALPDTAELWLAQQTGLARTGFRYHLRYMQTWLILLYALEAKAAADPLALVNDAAATQATLDAILREKVGGGDQAHDMRAALLHLAFPDLYEPILSREDKRKIADVLGRRFGLTSSGDVDEDLRRIRPSVAQMLDRKNFHYFDDDVKRLWAASKAPNGGGQTGLGPGNGPHEQPGGPGEPPEEMPADVQPVLDALAHTHNVILYGPPGTGKTFIARRAARQWVKPKHEAKVSPAAGAQSFVRDLVLYDVLSLAMYVSGPQQSYSVNELLQHPLVQARFELSPVQRPQNNLWGNLQNHTSPHSKTVKIANRWAPYLFDKDPDSRWRLTDEGRQYVQDNLNDHVQGWRSITATEAKAEDFVFTVTFHPNYAYEEFMEGLRPERDDEAPGGLSYEVRPGVFRQICARAESDPNNRYVLIIDEINRGNISKILGELMTLLEDDKRLGQRNEVKIRLPYSGVEFGAPANLYIIGTMNTTDRSIALLDMALRRRFAFVELLPQPSLLIKPVQGEDATVDLRLLLERLNGKIAEHLGRDHQLGHSYFLRAADATHPAEELAFVWRRQIAPLLREYYYARPDQLNELLAPVLAGETEGDALEQLNKGSNTDLLTALARLAQ